MKKSTNIDFEEDSYSETRDAATTIPHQWTRTHTLVISIEKEKSHGESEGYGDKPEDRVISGHCVQ